MSPEPSAGPGARCCPPRPPAWRRRAHGAGVGTSCSPAAVGDQGKEQQQPPLGWLLAGQGGAALTHFPLADDQVGVAEHLLLVVGVQDLALPQIGRDARGVNDRDELHPEALQGAPALILVLVVRHGCGGWGLGRVSGQARLWPRPELWAEPDKELAQLWLEKVCSLPHPHPPTSVTNSIVAQ